MLGEPERKFLFADARCGNDCSRRAKFDNVLVRVAALRRVLRQFSHMYDHGPTKGCRNVRKVSGRRL